MTASNSDLLKRAARYKADIEEAMEAHVTFYTSPLEVRDEQIDPLLLRAVRLINASGWVWTGESCQGHPDWPGPEGRSAWPHNNKPMLRLITRKARIGDVLTLLLERMESLRRDPDLAFYGSLELTPYPIGHDFWSEVLVYVQAHNAYERDLGCRMFEQFGELALLNAPLSTPAERELEDIKTDYLEAWATCSQPSLEQLVQRHPEHCDELVDFVTTHMEMENVLARQRQEPTQRP